MWSGGALGAFGTLRQLPGRVCLFEVRLKIRAPASKAGKYNSRPSSLSVNKFQVHFLWNEALAAGPA